MTRPVRVLIPTRRRTEADYAECSTCGAVFDEWKPAPWSFRKSAGIHSRNGRCGGDKAIRFYRSEVKQAEG